VFDNRHMNGEMQTMRRISENRQFATVVLMLVMIFLSKAFAASTGEAVWQPASHWQGNGLFKVANPDTPLTYDPLLLALGRSVYADLQLARQAVLDKKATNLMAALREADDTIHRLQLSPEVMALDAQLRVIRNDLKDRSKDLDKALWVPVEAEIDEVLVYAQDDIKKQTHAAVGIARAAAGEGDRQRVTEQLDVVTASLQYSLGIFPLSRVRQDLESARASADLAEPDWTGALEAVQSALSTFHWYTREPAQGLHAAYNDVINAYVLASGPVFSSDQKQRVVQYLERAERRLAAAPGGKHLATEASALIKMATPPGTGIKLLLEHIRSEIRLQQQEAESQYWTSIGRSKTE